MNKTAIVIGATGLTGSFLLNYLLQDNRFSKILTFVRKSSNLTHEKLEEHVINFDEDESWKHKVRGNVLFSCLGTTLAKAKSKDAQYKIDYSYQYKFARYASENGIGSYILVSSTGADAKSMIFYSRIKGELEDAVKKLPFKSVIIFRPGPLDGPRKEQRKMEQKSLAMMKIFNKVGIAKKYKPIHVSILSKAMINAYFNTSRQTEIFELLEIFSLAENKAR